MRKLPSSAVALLATLALSAPAILSVRSLGHERDQHFSAGDSGDPKKPAWTVKILMREEGKKMLFKPDLIEVRKDEQIHFVLSNESVENNHEFVLATIAENRKHAEAMKHHPDMEHEDPNAIRVATFNQGELLWRFSTKGEFEFACLIPGHYEAGMFGKIVVR
jgi:uncharacterized cupredoxin-like copper-binding protein